MAARDVIADNLKALRAAVPRYKSRPVWIEKTGVPNGPLGRIENATTNFGVDYLDGLAGAFGLAAWQLLVPGLKVSTNPGGKAVVQIPGQAVLPDQKYSAQADALAAQLDWIHDPVKRTEAWLDASEVIRTHFRRYEEQLAAPTERPAPLPKREKRTS